MDSKSENETEQEENKLHDFQFYRKFPVQHKIKIKGENIEEKNKVKLLGTIIINDLKWEENTKELVSKCQNVFTESSLKL